MCRRRRTSHWRRDAWRGRGPSAGDVKEPDHASLGVPATDAAINAWQAARNDSQRARRLDDALGEVIEHAAQLVGRRCEREQDHLIDAEVTVTLHEIEVGGSQ